MEPTIKDVTVRSRAIRLSATAAIVVVAAIMLVSEAREYTRSPWLTGNDLAPNVAAAAEWAAGGDAYEHVDVLMERRFGPGADYFTFSPPYQRNSHPPAMIVAHTPLTWLPWRAVRIGWLVASQLLVAGSMFAVARTVGARRDVAVLVGAGSLLLPFVRQDFNNAQVNSFFLAALTLAWFAWRRGADRRTGIALGVISTFKLFPMMFVVPLLRTRRAAAAAWQVLAATALGLAGVAAVGVASTQRWLFTAGPDDFRYWGPVSANISLPGLPVRYLTPSRWHPGAPDLRWLATALVVVLVAVCWTACAKTPARGSDRFWACLPWMLLGAPLAWESYVVMTLPLLVLLFSRWREHDRWGRTQLVLAAAATLGVASEIVAPILRVAGVRAFTVPAEVTFYYLPLYGLLGLAALEWRGLGSPGNDAGVEAAGRAAHALR